jgi:hypothetical protein
MSSANIIDAFTQAAKDLRFAFFPECEITLPNGKVVRALGLVRDFGSKQGMLIFSGESEPKDEDISALFQLGYVSTVLFESYKCYDSEHFKATLNDWPFFGPQASCPSWYTGVAWS